MSGLELLLLIARLAGTPFAEHPIHTAIAQVSYEEKSRAASVEIRVFANDLAVAVTGDSVGGASDSALRQYVAGKFGLFDRNGHPVPLRWMGSERNGDVTLIRLAATLPNGLSGAKIVSAILCDQFADQVNVVRVSSSSGAFTLLFTRGDGAKVIS